MRIARPSPLSRKPRCKGPAVVLLKGAGQPLAEPCFRAAETARKRLGFQPVGWAVVRRRSGR